MYQESNNTNDPANNESNANSYSSPNYAPSGSNPVWEPSASPQPTPSSKKKNTGSKIIALALCCSLVGGALGAGAVYMLQSRTPAKSSGTSNYLEGKRQNSTLQMHEIDTGKKMTAAQVYAQNVNSTVGITTSITTNFWGYQTTSAASGSGFILTDDGYILTNHHVIEGSSSVTVSLYDGTTYDAAVIGYDAPNDIAVLKVNAKDLTPVVLGDSDNMNVGDEVVAIGNPLGELTFSLTSGAVSALDREITMQSGASMNLIQTDCAINSGNSGGALFNLYGEVVGITNAKYSGNSGGGATIDNIGFAIPINHVWGMVKSIIENGYISKPYIGISVTDVSVESQSYGLPQGAAVRAVSEGGPAMKAGIQKNDIITEVNSTPVKGSSHLISMVKEHGIGDELTLTVYRQGENLEIQLKIGEQVQSAVPDNPAK